MTEDIEDEEESNDFPTELNDIESNSVNSTTYKVRGKLNTADATGVLGHNTASNGAGYGVEGVTESPTDGAAGVRGHATAGSGETWGVLGVSDGDTGAASGVRGEAGDAASHGVAGYNLSDPANEEFPNGTAGVFGNTDRSDDYGVLGWNSASSGFESIGVYGFNESPDAPAVFAWNQSTGPAVETNGDVKVNDATVQKTAGPIAKGTVRDDGTISGSVNVDSVTWNSSDSRWEVSISNVSYNFTEYTTVASALSERISMSVGSFNGDLLVLPGDSSRTGFSFVTHDIPSGTVTTSSTASTDSTTEPSP